MTPRSPRRTPSGRHQPIDLSRRVVRFDRTQRTVHWVSALVVFTLIATGAVLYIPSLSVAVGRRLLVENLHVFVGLAVFGPILVGVIGSWGRRLRRDLHSMSRLTKTEVRWLTSLGRKGGHVLGKFNPGQKLNTFAIGGLLTVLLLTGVVLRWGNFLPVNIRTGATFVHDLFAFALVALVIGHITFAVTHPGALRSMVTGRVTLAWVRRHAPAWRTDDDTPESPALSEPPHERVRTPHGSTHPTT